MIIGFDKALNSDLDIVIMDYNIFCLGDSITYGLNDSDGGWCDRLKKYYLDREIKDPEGLSVRVWNFGISGQTIKDFINKNRYQEPLSRIKKKKKNIFVVAFGANDAGFDTEKDIFLTSLEDFRASLKEITALYSGQGEIIFVNITPVSQSIDNKPDKYNCCRSNNYVSTFNEAIAEHSSESNSKLLDLNQVFSNFSEQEEKSLLSGDGLHPNSLGHNLIFGEIKNFLKVFLVVC